MTNKEKKSEKLNIVESASINVGVENSDTDKLSNSNMFTEAAKDIYSSSGSSNPIQKLNIYDNDFMPQEKADIQQEKVNNSLTLKNRRFGFRKILAIFKGLISKTPVLNYFILSSKRNKLKETLDKLNSISSEVDSLTSLKYMYGDDLDKYNILCSNLAKANQIHSQIIKEIQD